MTAGKQVIKETEKDRLRGKQLKNKESDNIEILRVGIKRCDDNKIIQSKDLMFLGFANWVIF